MKLSLLALAIALIMSACMTYDPANYDKLHDQEFEDHLKQNGGSDS